MDGSTAFGAGRCIGLVIVLEIGRIGPLVVSQFVIRSVNGHVTDPA